MQGNGGYGMPSGLGYNTDGAQDNSYGGGNTFADYGGTA